MNQAATTPAFSEQPAAPVIRTFLFTDIEGSTRTWQAAPDGMAAALERHDAILRETVSSHHGEFVKNTGDGIIAAFDAPRSALTSAVAAQRALLETLPFTVRMALATGEARRRNEDWFGPALNRCARLLAAGHGGQVLIAAATAALLRDVPPEDIALIDLGEHRLRDLPEPQRVFQAVAPGLTERHPPLRTAAAPVHTLPATRTALIGRDEELGELERLLVSNRMVTIAGIGGVGKTRLALEVGARTLPAFGGGTFFAELAPEGDASGVARAVADAIGLEGGGGVDRAALEQIVDFLAARRALLVLDNCEHLLDPCAALADTILDRCPDVTVVATSREPLGIDGERVWRAPSLQVTEDGGGAVELFLERAAAARGEALSADEAAEVSEVCTRLDGIPLALELAAAQTAHLSVRDISARLTDRFSLLTGGRRRVERQQTLLAAVDWSHDLLTEPERTLLRRLAVFPSWFTVNGVEAVCAEGLPGPPIQLLGSLVAKSLVVADVRPRGRYRLLETVRLYAEDRLLAAGEADHLRTRHRDWVMSVVARFDERERRSLEAGEVIAEVADDVRAAMRWSLLSNDLRSAALIARRTGLYWWLAGRADEGIVWLESTLDADLSPQERSRHLAVLANLATAQGEFDDVVRWATAAKEADPDPAGYGHLDGDLLLALMSLFREPRRTGELLESVINHASENSFWVRNARDMRAHLTWRTDPGAALAEWEDLAETSDVNRRNFEDFLILLSLGGARHVVGDHERTLEVAVELDRRGFSVWEAFHSYGSAFLRVLGLAGLGELDAARSVAVRLTEHVRRTAAALGEEDAGLACIAILFAEDRIEEATTLLGALRGDGEGMRLRTPISFAIYSHYSRRARHAAPPELSAQWYAKGRRTPVGALIDAALAGGAAS